MTRVAELTVESDPEGAQVSWDGDALGTTPLTPRLVDSGMHTVEVSKPGYATFKKTFNVAPKQLLTVQATLRTQGTEGNIDSRPKRPAPTARATPALRERGHAYLELMGGVGLATSLGGSSVASCDQKVTDPTDPGAASAPGCVDRSRPFGAFAGARGGYALTSHLGLELFLGYLSLNESVVRRLAVKANSDPTVLFADRYEDRIKVRGPVTALSISYALLRNFSLVARAWLGMTVVKVSATNSGSYAASASDPAPQRRSVSEAEQRAWIPFVGPELQAGYPLSPKFQLGLSIATLVAFAPQTPRTGTSPSQAEGRRYFTSTNPAGTFDLPREDALGTFVLFIPNVWLRAAF
jgi:hypothetical protein